MAWWRRKKQAVSEEKSISPTVAAEVVRTGLPNAGASIRKDGCISYDDAAKEAYEKNVIAYSSIEEVSASFASIPWLVEQVRGSGEAKEIVDPKHPLNALKKRPNPEQSWNTLLKWTASYLHVAGKCYIEALRPFPNKPPLRLYAHQPSTIKRLKNTAGLVIGHALMVDGIPRRIPEWDVDLETGKSNMFYYQLFNPRDPNEGMTPIEAAAMSVDIHNAGNLWNGNLLQSGASSDFAILTSQVVEEENKSRWRDRMRARNQGARNAGGFMILDNVQGEFKLEKISFSPRDMSWIESKHTSAHEVALALGGTAMPFLLGLPGMNTYANQSEARLAFYDTKILPLMWSFINEFNVWLAPMFADNLQFCPDLDEVTALEPRRESKWKRVNESTFLTINEKREALGYEPHPDGDKLPGAIGQQEQDPQQQEKPQQKPPVVNPKKAVDLTNGVTVH